MTIAFKLKWRTKNWNYEFSSKILIFKRKIWNKEYSRKRKKEKTRLIWRII